MSASRLLLSKGAILDDANVSWYVYVVMGGIGDQPNFSPNQELTVFFLNITSYCNITLFSVGLGNRSTLD